MKNPLFNKKHIREYLLYGVAGTVLFAVFLTIFLLHNRYENFYLLFIGNFLFTAVMGYYTYTLVYRPFEGKRSVSMMIAGHLALITGIFLSVLAVIIAILIFHPAIFSSVPQEELLEGAPASIRLGHPAGLLLMLLANVILVSGGSASFIIVIFSYAAKRNQTKDKPSALQTYIK